MNLNRPYTECLTVIRDALWEMFDQDPDRARAFRATERIVLNQLGHEVPPAPTSPTYSRMISGRHG